MLVVMVIFKHNTFILYLHVLVNFMVFNLSLLTHAKLSLTIGLSSSMHSPMVLLKQLVVSVSLSRAMLVLRITGVRYVWSIVNILAKMYLCMRVSFKFIGAGILDLKLFVAVNPTR